MALDKIWVVVDRSGDKPAPVSLELLSKAAQVGSTVEGVTWGDAGPLAADTGAHGATALHSVGDLGSSLPGPAVAAALAAQITAGSGPDAILIPQTYDGRDIAGRLSVRIDRPVLDQHRRPRVERRCAHHRARHLRGHRGTEGPLHRRPPPGSS